MFEFVIASACLAIIAAALPVAIFLFRRERRLRRTIRENEPSLAEAEVRKRACALMSIDPEPPASPKINARRTPVPLAAT